MKNNSNLHILIEISVLSFGICMKHVSKVRIVCLLDYKEISTG